jgi:acyl carrier protein
MSEEDFNKLRDIMSIVFDYPVEKIDKSFSSDHVQNWDSLRIMDLISSVEEEFQIVLDISEISSISSISIVLEMIRSAR